MRRGGAARRGLTMAEAVVSMLIVSIVLVAALNTVGAARGGMRITGDRARGALLAQQLMSEIMVLAYEDPELGGGGRGREPLETRATSDDVDDYHNLNESPLTYKDGAPVVDTTGWRRTVSVNWINPNNPSLLVGGEAGAKCVTVSVMRGDAVVSQLSAVRTRAWQDAVTVATTP